MLYLLIIFNIKKKRNQTWILFNIQYLFLYLTIKINSVNFHIKLCFYLLKHDYVFT